MTGRGNIIFTGLMNLAAGTAYRLVIVTQSSAKSTGNLLNNPREVKSEWTLTAQAESAGQA